MERARAPKHRAWFGALRRAGAAAALVLLAALALLARRGFAQNPVLDVQSSRTNSLVVHLGLASSCPTNTYTLMLSTSSVTGPWRDFEVNLGATGHVSFRDYLISNLQYGYFWTRESSDEDFDGDQLPNLAEFQHGADPLVADTDADGLSDGDEVNTWNCDPANPDTDSDGLPDGEECLALGSDPHNAVDAVSLREHARARIAMHWNMIYPEPLVFTNKPGSAADLQDMMTALSALSGKFYEEVPQE